MISCIIVDDEELAQNVLEKYIASVPWLNLAGKCDNAIEALSFLNNNKVDLIFLDIQMPELSGLKLMDILNELPKVVLTTAYSEYALESYNYSVSDYLLKPIEFERFLKAVNKVAKQLDLESVKETDGENKIVPESLFIYQDHVNHQIKFDDILYIKAEGNYISIITENKKYLTRETMQEVENRIDAESFIRVHKSYIVSLSKIDKTFGNTVVISNTQIPVGSVYKLNFMKKIQGQN